MNTPDVLLYDKLPSPPASVTLKSASTWVTVKMSLYVEPSFVNCHLSVPSSNCNFTFVDVPLSTSIPASCEGVPVSLLLRTIKLSSTVNVSVLTDVCVPLTVKFPLTFTSANVTSLVVATACPILKAPPEYVTPVPPLY